MRATRALHPIVFAVMLMAPALLTSAGAAPVKFTIEADYRLGYDLNPFLTSGDDLASGYVETAIQPKLTRRTEKGQIEAEGHFDRTGYLRRYGKSDQYGGSLQTQQRLTPKLTVFATLRYDSEVIGQNNDAVTGAPIEDIDVNLIGLRRREDSYVASGGFQYQITPKDTISADGAVTASRFGSGGSDSDNIGGRIGWQHAVNARTKIGVSASVYRIDYDTPGLNTMIAQPSVTFSTELSSAWHFDASLGVSFSTISQPLVSDQHSKGVAGTVNLCHKGRKDNFCFYGDRSVSASGAGGSVDRTQLGVSYNRQLTETLGFSSSASYSRSKSQTGLLVTREYLNARGGFDWQVTRWLKLGSEGRYRDVFGGPQVRADYGGELFATLVMPAPK